jgi:RNA polymerase sigma-70 factor (ECF subfamily)
LGGGDARGQSRLPARLQAPADGGRGGAARSAARDLARFGQAGAEAEDVVQETLLAIHVKRHTWDETRPFVPWVRAIARYKLLDLVRRRGNGIEVPVDALAETLPAATEDPERRIAVGECLDCLPARQREVVLALAVEGASVAETAQRLNTSHGAVRVALHRGLASLGARFGRWLG